ncbi:MAG: hypothetical protein E7433_02870 [Ruminococcaceae bacterium]|nr:hypothetical protein [Oscillospiraceae bacterium]
MKARLFALLLVAVMLLSACSPSNLGGTEDTTPSTTQTQTTTITTKPTEPPIPTPAEVIDGTYSVIDENKSDLHPELKIELFFLNNHNREYWEYDFVNILHTTADGKESKTQLICDPSNDYFKYINGDEKYTYRHLIYTPIDGGPEDDFDILHIVLLSDDPNATYLDTLDKENPTAVIVYARFVTLDESIDSYGDIPTIVKQEGVSPRESFSATFLKDSYFLEDYHNDNYPRFNNDATIVHRFDYNGNLLCSVTLPDYTRSVDYVELSDGGFIASSLSYENGRTHSLARYDADGNLLWTHDFSTAAVVDFHVVGDVIYCFGRSDNYDMIATTLSLDGEILSEKIILNGGYTFLHVVPEEDGFKIYAYGSNGNNADITLDRFYVLFDFELNVVKYEVIEDLDYMFPKGYLNGKTIFQNDPIFNYHPNETLPENIYELGNSSITINNVKVFPYQDGYIIVRQHTMGICCFTMSTTYTNYFENIYTYYDSEGVPQWQYVSPIYLA